MHASQLSYPAPDSSDVAFAAVSTTLHLGARGKVKLLVRLHNKLTPGLPAEMILISEPFDVSQSKDSSVLPQYAKVSKYPATDVPGRHAKPCRLPLNYCFKLDACVCPLQH